MQLSGQTTTKLRDYSLDRIAEIYKGNFDNRPITGGFTAKIKSLICKIAINSGAVVQPPQYLAKENLFYSAGNRNFSGQNLVSQGKWLVLWVKSHRGNYSNWIEAGRLLLLNEKNVEFKMENLLLLLSPNQESYYLGDGDKIGVSIADSGSGLLFPSDSVDIRCSFLEKFENFHITSGQSSLIDRKTIEETSQILLESNPRRVKVIFQNTGNSSIFVGYSPTASTSLFTSEIPPNYLTSDKDYKGTISAICNNGESSTLQITEVLQ